MLLYSYPWIGYDVCNMLLLSWRTFLWYKKYNFKFMTRFPVLSLWPFIPFGLQDKIIVVTSGIRTTVISRAVKQWLVVMLTPFASHINGAGAALGFKAGIEWCDSCRCIL